MTRKRIVLLLLPLLGACAVVQDHYMGCFRSTPSVPDLSTLALDRAGSPSECIKECRSRYYMFAGLVNGRQCYCGSKIGRYDLSAGCIVPCLADPTNYCGGEEAMSIYATGQKGPSPPRAVRVVHRKATSLQVTWEPPDIQNGNITQYNLRAIPIETYASHELPSIESQVQGGSSRSNATILQGLQPGTRYNVSITASNIEATSAPVYLSEWTSIGPPKKPAVPVIVKQTGSTITVLLSEAESENGPISGYQVFVATGGPGATVIPSPPILDVSGGGRYTNYESSMQQGLGYYATGEFDSSDFSEYKVFTVGDGKMIGGYYNAPLNMFERPGIGLVAISRFQREVRYAYSDTTNRAKLYDWPITADITTTGGWTSNYTTIALLIAISLLGALLVASILVYAALRQRHRKDRARKHAEQQELTMQGPVCEIDNMAYIPEDVPERVDYYQLLKSKVRTIPRESLMIDENAIIRRGRFGTIHVGRVEFRKEKEEERSHESTVRKVVVHRIADGSLKTSEKRRMLRELDVCVRMSTTRHLASLIGTCETSDTLYVILEMLPETLKARLLSARSGDAFPSDRILPMASAIARALQHLENHGIVHGHFTARSVGLYAGDWTPKLMGHGISRYSLEDVKYARWTAMECFEGSGCGKQRQQPSVVWAFGVVLWEMVSMGGTPYSDLSLESEVEEAVQRGVRLAQLLDTPDPLYEVMLSCWHVEPRERPTFAELTRLDTLSICPISEITEPYVAEWELY